MNINYLNVEKADFPEEDEGWKIIIKRQFALEMILHTMMGTEDLAAFCLAFEKDLEDLLLIYENFTKEIFQMKKP